VAKIKGFPLKTEWTVTSGLITVKARREATKIEEGPLPASVFDLPKGYKTIDYRKKTLEELMEGTK
jgi:hypothetical protein